MQFSQPYFSLFSAVLFLLWQSTVMALYVLVLLLFFGGYAFFYLSEGSEDVSKESEGDYARTYSDYP